MSTTSLWNNIYQVLNAKRLESRIIKVFGSKKIKGQKQVRQKSVYVTNARGDFETKCKLQQLSDTRKCQIMSNAFLKAKIEKDNVIVQKGKIK